MQTIKSKSDYHFFLKQDKIALGIGKYSSLPWPLRELAPNHIWKFQKLLRKVEYYKNCKTGLFSKLYFYYLKYRFRNMSMRLGFSIPENVFGPGLAIIHYGTIVVNSNAKVGDFTK